MTCCVYNMRTVLVVCNTYWNVYDAGDIRFSGIKVDGLLHEPESVSLARGRTSPDPDQNGEGPGSDRALEEDEDSGAEPDLPPGGQF